MVELHFNRMLAKESSNKISKCHYCELPESAPCGPEQNVFYKCGFWPTLCCPAQGTNWIKQKL